MNPEDSVSVAMATFNGEPFLGEQLASLFAQTRPPEEIVVCDDGSTDATLEILDEWRKRYPKILKLHRNPERLGVSRNFEKAIAIASGRYLFLADQDDVWEPDKIERMVERMKGSASPAGVFCDSIIVDEELNLTGLSHWSVRGFPDAPPDELRHFLRRVPAAGHDMAFDARLKEQLLPFPELPECHDTWIGLVLAALGVWNCLPERLTLFRQHRKNLSRSGRKLSPLAKLREARQSIANNTAVWNEAIYRALLERLGPNLTPRTRRLLQNRLIHSANRARMNVNFFRRLPLILGETVTGRYFRYARGCQSIFQDLFLR